MMAKARQLTTLWPVLSANIVTCGRGASGSRSEGQRARPARSQFDGSGRPARTVDGWLVWAKSKSSSEHGSRRVANAIAQYPALLAMTLVATACCHAGSLAPDKTRTAVMVSTKSVPSAGLVAPGWIDDAYKVVRDPSVCPTDKEKIEASLGIVDAEACGDLRKQVALAPGDQGAPTSGDGDAPLPKPVAPHCYPIGDNILVIQYEQPRTNCTRVVGLGVYPRKQ